jgi:molybdopterin-guanine dinucleotide biosynthesis protein A
MPAKPIRSGLRTVKTSEQSEHLWVIILAGGEGTRMRPLIHKWLGEDRPKQYCTFVGSRSMLQHTVDRALTLVDSAHILVVSMGGQRVFLNDITIAQPDATPLNGQLLEQPIDCGTGAAVLFGAAHVLSQDPDATLLILPSDHFFHPEERFQQYADLCMQYGERTPDRMVLLGATPHYAETDYGWIVPSLGKVREDWGSRSHTPMAVADSMKSRTGKGRWGTSEMGGFGTRWWWVPGPKCFGKSRGIAARISWTNSSACSRSFTCPGKDLEPNG